MHAAKNTHIFRLCCSEIHNNSIIIVIVIMFLYYFWIKNPLQTTQKQKTSQTQVSLSELFRK